MLSTTFPARRSRRWKRLSANAAPVDFDPTTHPIIAVHFFGVELPHPVGQIAAEMLADLRIKRGYFNQIDAYREWQRR